MQPPTVDVPGALLPVFSAAMFGVTDDEVVILITVKGQLYGKGSHVGGRKVFTQ